MKTGHEDVVLEIRKEKVCGKKKKSQFLVVRVTMEMRDEISLALKNITELGAPKVVIKM